MRTLIISILYLGVLFSAISATAETTSFRHTPPLTLAKVGEQVRISAQLNYNGQKLSIAPYIWAITDGNGTLTKMNLEVQSDGSVNYVGLIPAPLVELTYRLGYENESGKTILTPPFQLRRNCIPNLELTEIRDNDDATGQVGALVQRNKDIERELGLADQAAKTVEKLRRAIIK